MPSAAPNDLPWPLLNRERLRQQVVDLLIPLFDTKGELLKQDNQGANFLTNNLDFQKQVKNLKERLTTYCMLDVFNLYPIDATTGLPSSSTSVNLLDDYSNINQDLVLANSNMYYGYGDKVAGENLLWSKTLILASSDPDLRARIETQMANLPPPHDTGLTAFYFLASFIISTSDQVARAIVLKLSTMRLSNFPGEDVPLMAATVRGAASRLHTCHRLPLDINDIVLDILDSASNFKFRSHFETLQATRDPIMADWQQMLDRATQLYHTLLLKKRWIATRRPGTAFLTSYDSLNPDPAALSITSTSPTNLPTGVKLRTHDFRGQPIDRTAPSGSATSRTNSHNKTEYWCGLCDYGVGRWGSHPTSGHEAFALQRQARRAKEKADKAATKAVPAAPVPGNTTTTLSQTDNSTTHPSVPTSPF